MMKRMYVILMMFLTVGAFSQIVDAEVYINNVPSDITVKEGEALNVPLFLSGGVYTGKPIELFIWIESPPDNPELRFYLGPGGWTQFNGFSEIKPLLSVDEMIEYVNLAWTMFPEAPPLPPFRLAVCIDGAVDGGLPDGLATGGTYCDTKVINITPKPVEDCKDIFVYDGSTEVSSVSKAVNSGDNVNVQLSVKDSCGNAIDFTANPSDTWITTDNTQKGTLGITLDSASLSAGTYTGSVNLSAGDYTKTVSVSFTVKSTDSGDCPYQPPFDSFCSGGGGSGGGTTPPPSGGGGSTCSPVKITANPDWVALSAAPGDSPQSQSVSIMDNCDTNISFSATDDKNWISTSGTSGSLTITVDPAGQPAGTYTGTVTVTSGNLTKETIDVTMEVTGPCEPSSAKISPANKTKYVNLDEAPTDETVTVRDNCGNDLDFTVSAIDDPDSMLTAPAVDDTGTGSFPVKFNSFSTEGTHNAYISVYTSSYGTDTVQMTLQVTKSSGGGTGTYIKNGEQIRFTLRTGETKLFYGYANGIGKLPVQINLEDPYQDSKSNVDLIVKYAGDTCQNPPTRADYDELMSYIDAGNSACPRWNVNLNGYNPPRMRDDLYYCVTRSSFEFVEIFGSPDNPYGCYYMLLVNDGPSDEVQILYRDSDAPRE